MENSYGILSILSFRRRKLPRQSLSKVVTWPQMISPCCWYKLFSPLGGYLSTVIQTILQPSVIPIDMSWFAQHGCLPCSFTALAILTASIFDPAPVSTVSATTLTYLPTVLHQGRLYLAKPWGWAAYSKSTEAREVPHKTGKTLASQKASALSTKVAVPWLQPHRNMDWALPNPSDPSRERRTLDLYKTISQFWKREHIQNFIKLQVKQNNTHTQNSHCVHSTCGLDRICLCWSVSANINRKCQQNPEVGDSGRSCKSHGRPWEGWWQFCPFVPKIRSLAPCLLFLSPILTHFFP